MASTFQILRILQQLFGVVFRFIGKGVCAKIMFWHTLKCTTRLGLDKFVGRSRLNIIISACTYSVLYLFYYDCINIFRCPVWI